MTHKERMIERRARQLTRTAGFTPVPNRRIDAQITATIAIVKAAAEATGNKLTEGGARYQATRLVAAKLPAVPVGVRQKPYGARGKNYAAA